MQGRDILKGGILACEPVVGGSCLGVYYLLENIIHYYYCQSEGGEDSSQGGEDPPPSPPLEITLANTFLTSKERTPLYNEQINVSQRVRSEVPLHVVLVVVAMPHLGLG